MPTPDQDSSVIRVGPAGWSYEDWKGTVYPKHTRKFDPLGFLSHYFDTIEINSPFYRVPPVAHAKSWSRRVESNRNFRFTTKLFRGFTHDKQPGADDVSMFRAYLDVLQDAGLLGALLIQFPWSFKWDETSQLRLRRLFTDFAGYPKAIEVRHASFDRVDFREFLTASDAGLVNIDQPLFDASIAPSDILTNALGYVRFHGRNYEKWFAHSESWERYDYLYSRKELEPWVDRIRTMDVAAETYVITNNHFRGQAVLNGLELKRMLGQRVEIPEQLAATYEERARAISI
ncbi:MAG TPA: DUF72 domain-containing protein [Thermoanaerobaculia bacterium]|nr:DUF72 domain-containing protein [Thermoanaerobaculia bacterium]